MITYEVTIRAHVTRTEHETHAVPGTAHNQSYDVLAELLDMAQRNAALVEISALKMEPTRQMSVSSPVMAPPKRSIV